jgi:hypothetical protein
MSASAQIVEDGGYILTAARCNDGFPAHEARGRRPAVPHLEPESVRIEPLPTVYIREGRVAEEQLGPEASWSRVWKHGRRKGSGPGPRAATAKAAGQSERCTAGQIQAPASRVRSSRRRAAKARRVRWRRATGLSWRA